MPTPKFKAGDIVILMSNDYTALNRFEELVIVGYEGKEYYATKKANSGYPTSTFYIRTRHLQLKGEYQFQSKKESKQFKNSFGVRASDLHLKNAFIKAAEEFGWKYQEPDYNPEKLTLYFNGQSQAGDTLKSGHFWIADGYGNKAKVYQLPKDWDIAMKAMQEELPKKEPIKVGDMFTDNITKKKYILSLSGRDEVQLTNLFSGEPFTFPIRIKNKYSISDSDWNLITDKQPQDFVRIYDFERRDCRLTNH